MNELNDESIMLCSHCLWNGYKHMLSSQQISMCTVAEFECVSEIRDVVVSGIHNFTACYYHWLNVFHSFHLMCLYQLQRYCEEIYFMYWKVNQPLSESVLSFPVLIFVFNPETVVLSHIL
jgi:hypothetical protein